MLNELRTLGFQPCKYLVSKRRLSVQETEGTIQQLRQYAKDNDPPIDGIVATYNDVANAKNCGRTGHHYKDGLAFKFVVIDGRTISRASLSLPQLRSRCRHPRPQPKGSS